jgi:hypothetical protein
MLLIPVREHSDWKHSLAGTCAPHGAVTVTRVVGSRLGEEFRADSIVAVGLGTVCPGFEFGYTIEDLEGSGAA